MVKLKEHLCSACVNLVIFLSVFWLDYLIIMVPAFFWLCSFLNLLSFLHFLSFLVQVDMLLLNVYLTTFGLIDILLLLLDYTILHIIFGSWCIFTY